MNGLGGDGRGLQESLLERARRVLPHLGPFGSVPLPRHDGGCYPQFAERAEGSRFWDVTGTAYVDWFLGGGVATLGHNHPHVRGAVARQLERGANLSLPTALEVEVAERICELFPSAQQVMFGKNGTDATSGAVKLARAVTGREHVLLCGYHGFQDWSKAAVPDCAGIPAALRGLVHEFRFNDQEHARELLERLPGLVAAIFVEPVRQQGPRPGFLQALRELSDDHGCLLVLDEVVTGLRVARGGVQARERVRPDLTCLAKSLANGLPLSAWAGPQHLMRHVPATQFGLTHRRDALALAAAAAALEVHRDQDVSGHLALIGERLRTGFAQIARQAGIEWTLSGDPTMLHLVPSGGGRISSLGAEALFTQCCQREGVYIQPPRLYPSLAHTTADVEHTLAVAAKALRTVRRAMEEGLEGLLDGPITSGMQDRRSPPEVTQKAPTRESRAALQDVHADERPVGLRVTSYPSDDHARAWEEGDRVLLRVSRGEPGQPVGCQVTLLAQTGTEFRAAASYRWLDWQPGNSFVRVTLVARCLEDGTTCEVHHDTLLGQPAWSRATLARTSFQSPCRYGVSEGELGLEVRGGTVRAWHETDRVDELGQLTGFRGRPMELSFGLHVTGLSGPVSVEVTELALAADLRDG